MAVVGLDYRHILDLKKIKLPFFPIPGYLGLSPTNPPFVNATDFKPPEPIVH